MSFTDKAKDAADAAAAKAQEIATQVVEGLKDVANDVADKIKEKTGRGKDDTSPTEGAHIDPAKPEGDHPEAL